MPGMKLCRVCLLVLIMECSIRTRSCCLLLTRTLGQYCMWSIPFKMTRLQESLWFTLINKNIRKLQHVLKDNLRSQFKSLAENRLSRCFPITQIYTRACHKELLWKETIGPEGQISTVFSITELFILEGASRDWQIQLPCSEPCLSGFEHLSFLSREWLQGKLSDSYPKVLFYNF